MNKAFGSFIFVKDYKQYLSIKINDYLIKKIISDNVFFKAYFFFILKYMQDNDLFLKYNSSENTNIDEVQQKFFIDDIKLFFSNNFSISISSVEEEVLFIPLDIAFTIYEKTYLTQFEKYLEHIIYMSEYHKVMYRKFIEEYRLLPIKKEWVCSDSKDRPDIEVIKINFNNFMNNEVLRKYSLENDVRLFNKNGKDLISIEDDKAPLFMFLNKLNNNQYGEEKISKEKETYFINPNMAKMFRGNVLGLDLMLNMLGYSTKEVFELLKKVSNKKLSLAIIGLGGTMSNFVYFATELAKLFKLEKNVFKNVVVYENDNLEVSNLPRIPLDYITPIFTQNDIYSNLQKKVLMLYNVDKLADNVVSCIRKINPQYKIEENFNFIIGTPDISTRTSISEFSKNFICPMHSDNELYIYIAPKVVNSDLMYETYGRIRLSKFFFNMLEMTIQCLRLMLNNDLSDKAEQMVYQYSIDNVDIDKNMVDFKRKERVMI